MLSCDVGSWTAWQTGCTSVVGPRDCGKTTLITSMMHHVIYALGEQVVYVSVSKASAAAVASVLPHTHAHVYSCSMSMPLSAILLAIIARHSHASIFVDDVSVVNTKEVQRLVPIADRRCVFSSSTAGFCKISSMFHGRIVLSPRVPANTVNEVCTKAHLSYGKVYGNMADAKKFAPPYTEARVFVVLDTDDSILHVRVPACEFPALPAEDAANVSFLHYDAASVVDSSPPLHDTLAFLQKTVTALHSEIACLRSDVKALQCSVEQLRPLQYSRRRKG
jgi:hypothetical protein